MQIIVTMKQAKQMLAMKNRWTVMSAVELFKPEHLWQTAASVSFESLPKTHCLHKDSYTFFLYCRCKKQQLRFAGSNAVRTHRIGSCKLPSISFIVLFLLQNILLAHQYCRHKIYIHPWSPRAGGGAQPPQKITQSYRKQISPSKSQFTHSSFSLLKYTSTTHLWAKEILFVFFTLTRVMGTKFAIIPLYSNAQTHWLIILKRLT